MGIFAKAANRSSKYSNDILFEAAMQGFFYPIQVHTDDIVVDGR